MLTSQWPLLAEAHELLTTAAHGASIDQLHRPSPCNVWSVAQVVQHASLDQLIWSSLIAEVPAPEGDAFAPDGELPGTAAECVEAAVQASAAVWCGVAADATVPTPLPQGQMPAEIAAKACAIDAAIHAWDIAVATSQKADLSPDLAEQLTPVAQTIVEPLRQYGAYAPALPEQPGDDPAEILLRYLGRNPHWSG